MATIKKRKNKNGTLSYEAMIRLKDGLPPRYKRFPTRQEAKDWALQQEAQRRQGLYFPEQIKSKRTFSDLVDRYVEQLIPSKPKNIKDTLRHLNWWSSKLGKCTLNLITPELISEYRKELVEGITLKGTKRSPATTNRYLAALSVVFSYGIKECGWLSSNPVLRVRKFKESRGRNRNLTPDECSRLLEACAQSKCPVLLPFILIAMTTGARRSELLSLIWDQVNLENGTIHLHETKNGRPRILVLVGQTLELVRKLFQERDPSNQKVFPSKTYFGTLTLRKPWMKALKDAQLSNLKLHDLRHFFCTTASELGFSNIELQTASGHSTLSQLSRYCHPNSEVVRRLSQGVSNQLELIQAGDINDPS